MDRLFKGSFSVESNTETAGTIISDLISPKKRTLTRITNFVFRSGSTAHTLIFMVPVGTTTTSAAAAASQTDMTLTSIEPEGTEDLAASDYLVWEDASASGFSYDLIASIDVSTKIATMTSNLPAAVVAGAKVWALYEVGRASHHVISPGASATTIYSDPIAGIFTTASRYSPILIYNANATAASFHDAVSGYYAAS